MEDLAGKPSPWYGEVEAISGDGTSSVLKRGTPSAVLLRKYGSIRACAMCTEDACISDFRPVRWSVSGLDRFMACCQLNVSASHFDW